MGARALLPRRLTNQSPAQKMTRLSLALGALTRGGFLASDRRQPRKSLMGGLVACGSPGAGPGWGWDETICRVGLPCADFKYLVGYVGRYSCMSVWVHFLGLSR